MIKKFSSKWQKSQPQVCHKGYIFYYPLSFLTENLIVHWNIVYCEYYKVKKCDLPLLQLNILVLTILGNNVLCHQTAMHRKTLLVYAEKPDNGFLTLDHGFYTLFHCCLIQMIITRDLGFYSLHSYTRLLFFAVSIVRVL